MQHQAPITLAYQACSSSKRVILLQVQGLALY
jgi:hypothetical protein